VPVRPPRQVIGHLEVARGWVYKLRENPPQQWEWRLLILQDSGTLAYFCDGKDGALETRGLVSPTHLDQGFRLSGGVRLLRGPACRRGAPVGTGVWGDSPCTAVAALSSIGVDESTRISSAGQCCGDGGAPD
jgi:hypothetical protein